MASPTAIAFAFESLPVELAAYILEWTCEMQCQDIKMVQRETSSIITYKSLLGPTQISSRSRQVALRHPPIWRSIAEAIMVLPRWDDTTTWKIAKQVLELCAKRSNQILSRINFMYMCYNDDCQRRKERVVAIVQQSVDALKELTIPFVNGSRPDGCDCHYKPDPQGIDWDDDETWEDWNRTRNDLIQGGWPTLNLPLLKLLYKAPSLQRLTLELENISDLKGWVYRKTITPQMVKARPPILKVSESIERWQPSNELIDVLCQLGQGSKELNFTISRLNEVEYNSCLLPAMVRTAAPSLHLLHLDVRMPELNIEALLRNEFPLLERLSVVCWNWGAEKVPTSADGPMRSLLPALKRLDGPVWLVDYVDAPKLDTLTIRDFRSVPLETDSVIEALKLRLGAIKDLTIRCPAFEERTAGPTSKMLQRILQALTPSSRKPCLCPALRRLSIRGSSRAPHLKGPQDEDEFVEPKPEATEQPLWWICDAVKVPHLGFDLVELDRKRSADARCQPLNTVLLDNCVVDPAAWSEFVETSKCENKWMYIHPKTLETAKPVSEVLAADGK